MSMNDIKSIFLLGLVATVVYLAGSGFADQLIHYYSNIQALNNSALAQAPDTVCNHWVIEHLIGKYDGSKEYYRGADGYCLLWTQRLLSGGSIDTIMVSYGAQWLVILGILLEEIEKMPPRRTAKSDPAIDICHTAGVIFLVEGLAFEMALALGGFHWISEPYEHRSLVHMLGTLNYNQTKFTSETFGVTLAALHVLPFLIARVRLRNRSAHPTPLPPTSPS